MQLTEHEAFYTDLVFSPDGERIVGLRGNAYMRHQTFSEFGGLRIPLDLVWMDADGGDVQLVAPARGVGAPHFAGDPDRIYVYANAGLISLRYDGTDRRTHLRVTGPQNPALAPPAASADRAHAPGRRMGARCGEQAALGGRRSRGGWWTTDSECAGAGGTCEAHHRHRGRLLHLGGRRRDDRLGDRLHGVHASIREHRLHAGRPDGIAGLDPAPAPHPIRQRRRTARPRQTRRRPTRQRIRSTPTPPSSRPRS